MVDIIGVPVAPCTNGTSPIATGPYQKLYTWLSPERYARIMGITPAHFWTAESEDVFPADGGACTHLWWLYDWQNNDAVGRDTLTRAIYDAEQQVSRLVGFPLAPEWVSEEVIYYDKYYRPNYVDHNNDVLGRTKALKAKWRKVISPGVRKLTPILTVTTVGGSMVLMDLDGDGFKETVRMAAPTTFTNVNEIKAYFPTYSGARGWEIRSPRKKWIIAGNVVFDFFVWQCIKPEIYEQYLGTDPLSSIDMTNTNNIIASAEIYRETTDTTAVSAELYWEGTGSSCYCLPFMTSSCASCGLTEQDGCLGIRDAVSGYVAPAAATYSIADAVWYSDAYAICRQPDFAKIWYQAGDIAPEYLNNESYDPLSHYWAQIIAWLATARLERPLCECSNVTNVFADLSTDMAKSSDGNARHTLSFEQIDNPLGTRKGEIMAYKRLKSLGFDITGVAF